MKQILILACLCASAMAQTRGVRPVTEIRVQRKLALVIGNGAYPGNVLKNPRNDAAAVARTLRTLGFDDVTEKHDLNNREMREEIDKFAASINKGDLVWVYYAGHGVQANERNYLIPVDFKGDEADLNYEAYPADQLRDKLEKSGARLRILVLDACRNNPFRRSKRDGTHGLVHMDSSMEGTYIAFATADNSVAEDNPGESNGLFTKYLLTALTTSGMDLKQAFERTKEDVYAASDHHQRPYTYDGVVGQYYFNNNAPPGLSEQEEIAFWNGVDKADPQSLDLYLQRFPQGRFAPLARRNLAMSPAQQGAGRPLPVRALVSGAPVSGAPVSGAPVSSAPVSRATVGSAPVSRSPVSSPPVSSPPVSSAPVSGAPVSGALVSGAPVSGAPVSGPPVSGPPVSSPTPGTVKTNPKDGQRYVWIPPGNFMMGCSPGDRECSENEKPAHHVEISKGFWLAEMPVTVGAWKRYAAALGESMPPEPKFDERALNANWSDDRQPMVNITWSEAGDYCRQAGGRLPTEGEWEYAARAGSTESRHGPLDAIAWDADNSGKAPIDSADILKTDDKNYARRLNANGNVPHGVAQKDANAWKLYDMLGNVYQWTANWYHENYYKQNDSKDPQGPPGGQFRTVRGGSWVSDPRLLRVSCRMPVDPSIRRSDIGVRCAWE
ncbi:MAG TPA: SUMF1/EgtB/PvdO family nonheme iron enzyme [Bryobacteraceae bacterium]|nr:SUMF1/EgtB/PvdO family nonheme iron enzyme [Bryobacteraceae bacterium]